ncbi:MarR family transcriptional regulator [Streptomyces sp. NPDC056831]|uniref:MarR family transcriptional regulator n=1 Tax=Streptomyces sp. NPDC056831 TaxID=3345954 RepID=UPI0036BE2B7B
MATQNHSPAPYAPASSPAYPMAKPGYGKRSAPDQRPRHADDFALLPERERYVAGFVDHLPDGAAMNVKALAKQLPLYGQQAVGSALTALSVAGHLRRVRRLVGENDQVRWVFRTFWSRTARDNEWWADYLAAEDNRAGVGAEPGLEPSTITSLPRRAPAESLVPAPGAAADGSLPAPLPVATPRPEAGPAPAGAALPQPESGCPSPAHPSPAYLALAQLGRMDHRLALSAADCEALEGRATEWLARGVSTDYLTQALTAGLPAQVDSPVGFLRRRLNDKIPPVLPVAPEAPVVPARRVMVECTRCGTPGRPDALPDGLCRPCRQVTHGSAVTPDGVAEPAVERDVRACVSELRDLLKVP